MVCVDIVVWTSVLEKIIQRDIKCAARGNSSVSLNKEFVLPRLSSFAVAGLNLFITTIYRLAVGQRPSKKGLKIVLQNDPSSSAPVRVGPRLLSVPAAPGIVSVSRERMII
jgi:hypothetical protein